MEDFEKVLNSIIKDIRQERYENNEINIAKQSPFSEDINKNISTIKELKLYLSENLKEEFVTRLALIRDIDIDFIDPKKHKTNLELMLSEKPPIDPITKSTIHLHHIGQDFNAPFVELPQTIHSSPQYRFLLHHKNHTASWRQDEKKKRMFDKERKQYWKKRGEKILIEKSKQGK